MFQGFSQATGDFIWSLAMNNDRAWFQAHRDEFEAHLNQPFKALAADTLQLTRERWPKEDFQVHVSRIYRDARRLFGRGPYKDRLWFTLQRGVNRPVGPSFWFELDGMSYSYGVGMWEDAADLAEGFRRAVDADPAAFEKIVDDLAARGEYRLWGSPYKRLKADRGEKLNPWYNRRHISAGYECGYGGPLYGPELPRVLLEAYDGLMPLYLFCRQVFDTVQETRAALRERALYD